jgi:hypothetical protein
LQLLFPVEFLELLGLQHFFEQAAHGGHVEDGWIDRYRVALHLDGDRRADRKEEVGCLLLGHQPEQLVHRAHRAISL